jgi:hypothetical protein
MIQVVSSTGDEVFFKIKRNTKLSKLQGAYATKVGKDVASIRYVPALLCCVISLVLLSVVTLLDYILTIRGGSRGSLY